MIAAIWNLLVCLVVSLVCWSFLLGNRTGGRHELALNAGLLLLAVGMFTSAFAPIVRDHELGWWTLLARTGSALVAAVLYESRFGTRAQALALYLHWRQALARLRELLARVQQARGPGVRR